MLVWHARRMRIAIASDHAGFRLKQVVRRHLDSHGHEVTDHGTPRRRCTSASQFPGTKVKPAAAAWPP